jgi:hypothetical protein
VSDLIAQLETMTPDERRGALIVLDALSRPLLPKEIEAALYSRGTPRSQRKAIVAAVKSFNIIPSSGLKRGGG